MFTLNEINAEIENWNSCDKFDLSTIESEDSSLLNTLLVNSIKYKSYKVLDHLIQKVSDLNYVDNDGNGFLHIIIQNLNLDNLEDFFIFDRVLYSGKIDLNQLNDKSETSFNLFLKKVKNNELFPGYSYQKYQNKINYIVESFLIVNVNLSIQDQNGTCPLDLLKSSFGEYISDLLKKRKHIINAPNIFNVTPLISATFNCNHVKIEWLLNNGAIPNLKSTITPNDLFDSPGISFLKLYNNDGICYNSPITKKSEGISPLMVAMDDKSIDLLIKGGADIFELDDNGNSPFMLYIIRPWAFGALYLEKYISNKYDLRNYINYKNNNKQSSVYLFNKFCRNKWNERKFNPELIKLLEENSTWGWLDQFTQFRINFFKE